MILTSNNRRVAIVGLPYSGKTVMLTSLLTHLANLSSSIAVDGQTPCSFKIKRPPRLLRKVGTEFPFESNRTALVKRGVFPDRTGSDSAISFELQTERRKETSRWPTWAMASREPGKSRKRYRIDIIDVPGERFYDADMIIDDYGKWCDSMQGHWDEEEHPAITEYRNYLRQDGLSAPAIVERYRTLLAQLVADFRICISPSSFLVTRDGQRATGSKFEQIRNSAASNPCGLTLETQFAPLPDDARERHPEVAKRFAQFYRAYRFQFVYPLFKEMSRCDRLMVLIDIPRLLTDGPLAVNAQSRLVERVVEALAAPRDGINNRIGRFFRKLFGGHISKIAFIATKSDIVACQDVDRLQDLLNALVIPTRSALDGVPWTSFPLAAVKSTAPVPDAADDGQFAHLTGRLQYDYSTTPPSRRSPRDGTFNFKVRRLPTNWPSSWEPDKYTFPPVYPEVPSLRFSNPPHSNLDKVLKFILT